ncbi:MAG TPA: YceD family protein [Atopostipes sp.]|jgi:Predicted metal-binding, possibly nucleic acid-binding protein|nr:YceD family protein [Atopostipes sp.]
MKLKWSLAELHKQPAGMLMLDEKVDVTDSLKERNNDLIDASVVDVQGAISIEAYKRYFVDLTLNVVLTLPSSRSLEPVELNLTVPFSEVYLAPDAGQTAVEDLDDEVVFSLEQDILDLQKPIEDTILASIPMKVLSEEEQTSNDLPMGNDWEVKLEGDVDSSDINDESDTPENSPFAVLKDLDLDFSDNEDEQ